MEVQIHVHDNLYVLYNSGVILYFISTNNKNHYFLFFPPKNSTRNFWVVQLAHDREFKFIECYFDVKKGSSLFPCTLNEVN